MRHHQRLFIHILSSAALLSVLGGCFASTSVEKPPAPRRLTVGPGKLDVANRHLSSVMIKASVEQRDRSICSGVLISPSLVLTAGHCVCKDGRRVQGPNGEERLVFNGSSCQQRVIVKTYVYELRRVGDNKVKDKKELVQSEALKGVLADAEKIVFDRTGALALGGDSGGPCLQMKRNTKGTVVFSLVGIASWSTANESIFTSAYQHREWLGERKRCSLNEACRSRIIEQGETH